MEQKIQYKTQTKLTGNYVNDFLRFQHFEPTGYLCARENFV